MQVRGYVAPPPTTEQLRDRRLGIRGGDQQNAARDKQLEATAHEAARIMDVLDQVRRDDCVEARRREPGLLERLLAHIQAEAARMRRRSAG